MKVKNKLKMILLLGLLFVLQSSAQNIIRPKIAGPNDLWVNSYNGVLFFGKTDMETQNTQMPMQLRFYYNSSANTKDYGYGLGFSMEYEMRYHIDEIGNIVVFTGDGRSDIYKKIGNEYISPAGVFNKLKEYEYNKFLLIDKTGKRYFFDEAKYGKLTKIEDRHGNKTMLMYNDSLLVKVVDAVGHTLNLSYVDGLLKTAKSSFHKGAINYEYDGLKRLRKRTDAMGFSTLYGYDKFNRINEITDANGHKTFISYNQGGMVSRLKTDVSDKSIRYEKDKTIFIDYTKPKNIYSYYRWDEKGRVIEKSGLCCGIQSKIEYDDDDNVIKRTDAKGNSIIYTYDDNGNMLSMTDPLGYVEQYSYEPKFNNIATYKDKNGNTYKLDYNGKGDLVSLSGPIGFSNNFTYNERGWCVTSKDANNNVTATTYNVDGTIQKVLNAVGYSTSYTYDESGNALTITDALNNTIGYTYDNNNRILSQKDALGNISTFSYNKLGNVVRIKDAGNQITAFSYDALGRIQNVTNPMGGVYAYTYDGRGNILSIKDPMGNEEIYFWNERNKIQSITNAMGEKTLYDYDVNGNLITQTLPNGNVISYFYDALNNVEKVSDDMGVIAKYVYDGNGNVLQVTDGLDRTLTYSYDALNRNITETLPSGSVTKYAYDANSNQISVEDALGNITQYSYNALNNVVSRKDAIGAVTKFNYDGNGNLLKITDAKGNVTEYTYDALNRNTVITFANGTSLQYTYDAMDNVVSFKDRAGNEFKYEYSVLNDLLAKIYPDGTKDTYTYDALGHMLSAVNKNAKVFFTYDNVGRILSETLNGKTTEYSYDVSKGLRTMVYPSGMKVEEHLNARNLISSIFQNGKEMVTMEYNPAGQKIRQVYANGVSTDYGFNSNGWLETIKDDHDVLNLNMIYDKIGNITKRENLLRPEFTESYGYDAISQLVSFSRGESLTKTYEFDLLGNRVRTTENGIETRYTADNINAYTSISGGLTFIPEYDGNGNLLNNAKNQFVYDLNNKLVSVNDNKCFYKYDALGRRIAKNNISYYYVGEQMIEEVTANKVKSYLYGNNIDEILQCSQQQTSYWYHTNHLGSTIALSGNNGITEEMVDYDVYGTPTFLDKQGIFIEKSKVSNNLLFTGREYDIESSSYYYRARTLNPLIGRFMQHDPMGYVDGMNDINYVLNIPTILTDPSGEISILTVIVGIGWGLTGWNLYNTWNDECMSNKDKLKHTMFDVSLNVVAPGVGKTATKIGGPLLRKILFGSGKNSAFWSKLGEKGAEAAAYIAKRKGWTTLELTPLGKVLTKYDSFITKMRIRAEIWKWASGQFSKNAKGTVHKIFNFEEKIRHDKSFGKIWNEIERPTLRKNGNPIHYYTISREDDIFRDLFGL